MYLTNRQATGVVAASEYGIEYYICANMAAKVTPADNPACTFDLYNNDGKCCPCTASRAPCHPGLDLRMNEATVTDNEGLGLSTDGCNFTTSKEQRLLFFARRRQDGSLLMVYQLIGFTDVKPLPSDGSVAEVTVNGSIVGPLIGVAIVLALAILLFIATGVGCIHRKRRKGKQNMSTGYHL